MDYSESVVAEEIDAILQRSARRLQQQRDHLQSLPKSGIQTATAKALLRDTLASHQRLESYRKKFW